MNKVILQKTEIAQQKANISFFLRNRKKKKHSKIYLEKYKDIRKVVHSSY